MNAIRNEATLKSKIDWKRIRETYDSAVQILSSNFSSITFTFFISTLPINQNFTSIDLLHKHFCNLLIPNWQSDFVKFRKQSSRYPILLILKYFWMTQKSVSWACHAAILLQKKNESSCEIQMLHIKVFCSYFYFYFKLFGIGVLFILFYLFTHVQCIPLLNTTSIVELLSIAFVNLLCYAKRFYCQSFLDNKWDFPLLFLPISKMFILLFGCVKNMVTAKPIFALMLLQNPLM